MPAKIAVIGTANVEQWDKAIKKTQEMQRASIDAQGKVAAGMMVAGAVIVAGLDAATNAAVAYVMQVVDVQRLTGLGAEESSKWAAILDRYGVSGKSAGTAIKTLAQQIIATNEASDKSKTALGVMGVATEDATGKVRDQMSVLADVAEWYHKSGGGALANAEAAKVLGKNYMALLPILANGKAGIDDVAASAKAAGRILGQDSIDAVKAFSKALKDDEEAAKGLEVQVGLMVLPLKMQLTQAIGAVLGWFEKLDPGMKQVIVTGAEVTAGVLLIGGALVAVGLVGPLLATGLTIVSTAFAGTALGAIASALAVGGLSAAMDLLTISLAASPVGWALLLAGIVAVGVAIPVVSSYMKTYSQYQKEANDTAGASADVQAMMAKMYDATTGALTDYGRLVKEVGVKAADLTYAEQGLTVAVDGTTQAWQAQTLVMSVGRSEREAALQNVVAVKDAQLALTAARKAGDPAAIALAEMKLKDAMDLAVQTNQDLTKKQREQVAAQILATVKTGAMTVAQGNQALSALGLANHIKKVNDQLKLIKDKHATVTVDIKNGIGAGIFATGAGFKLGLTGWLKAAAANKAWGDIITGGRGTLVNVAENGKNETLINWGASAARNLALLATTARGGAFGPMPSLAFAGGGSSSSRTVIVAEGAVQLSFPGGTSATKEEVKALIKDGLKQLADGIARR